MKIRILLPAVFCAALAGCQSFQAVEATDVANVGDEITVDPQLSWAKAADPLNDGLSGTVWTIDGFGLDELRFLTGVASGSSAASDFRCRAEGYGPLQHDNAAR